MRVVSCLVILIFSFLSIFVSCDTKRNHAEIPKESPNVAEDSSYYFKQLALEDTRRISDSFYLRIWLTYSALLDSGKIVNISYRKNTWKAEYLGYRFMIYSEDDTVPTLTTKILKIAEPKSGWPSFLKRLEDIGVNRIAQQIPQKDLGIGLCSDANILRIELIASRKSVTTFYCWEAIENKTEVNRVASALLLIEEEFGFPISPLY